MSFFRLFDDTVSGLAVAEAASAEGGRPGRSGRGGQHETGRHDPPRTKPPLRPLDSTADFCSSYVRDRCRHLLPATKAWALGERFALFIGRLRLEVGEATDHNAPLTKIAARLWNRLPQAAERFAVIAAHPTCGRAGAPNPPPGRMAAADADDAATDTMPGDTNPA